MELKDLCKITDIEKTQVTPNGARPNEVVPLGINYSRFSGTTGLKIGLVINFGGKSLEWEKVIY